MAATGFTPVYIYASGTTGNIPSASNLTNTTNGSEIALNYFDGNLFYKNNSNSVVTVPLLQSSGSQNGWLSSTDWNTFNNKVSSQWITSGSNIYYGTGNVAVGGSALAGNSFIVNKNTTGAVQAWGIRSLGQIQSDVTTAARIIESNPTIVAASFTLPNLFHFSARPGAYGAGSSVTAQYGFYSAPLTQATANYGFFADNSAAIGTGANAFGFYSAVNTATGGGTAYGFYAAGTALNYFTGAMQTATSVTTPVLYATDGTTSARIVPSSGISYWGNTSNHPVYFQTNNTVQMAISAAGGVSIGNTTDPGAANLSVTGAAIASSFIPTSSTVPSNGMYLAGSNTLGWGTNSTFRMSLDSTGALATTGSITSNTTVTATTTLKANLAVGSGASIDTSGQTALTLTASSNGLLVSGGAYYLVIISEVTQTGQSGVYMLTNGSASLVSNSTLAGTSYWVASTTTPSNNQFSIAYSGGNYRLYNGCTTAGTYTFKATIIKVS